MTRDIITYYQIIKHLYVLEYDHSNKCINLHYFISFYDQIKEVICLAVLAIDDGSSKVTLPSW